MSETMFTYIQKEQSCDLDVIAKRQTHLLPFIDDLKQHHKLRWVVLATGSSANAIEAAKYYVENIAKVHVDIRIPFLFSNYPTPVFDNELYIAVSQSGHSYSTIEALKRVKGNHVYVMCADNTSPIKACDASYLDIGCGKEHVDLVTMGFSATVVNFMLMGLEAAKAWDIIDVQTYEEELKKLTSVVSSIDETIASCIKFYEQNQVEFLNMKEVALIGYGCGYGVAKEGETKITETIGCSTHGYELEEYMHGPYLAMHKDLTVFFLESEHPSLVKRMRDLKRYMKQTTSHCFTISTTMPESSEHKACQLKHIEDEHVSSILLVVMIQYLSYRVCADKGMDPMISEFDDFDEVMASKV